MEDLSGILVDPAAGTQRKVDPVAGTRRKVGPGRGEDGLGTCGEKETTTALSSTFAIDETPSPHVRPFLPLFPRSQRHNVVVVLQSRGKTTVEVTVRVKALHRTNVEVGTVPVLCWKPSWEASRSPYEGGSN